MQHFTNLKFYTNYNGSRKTGNNTHGFYVYHEVSCTITTTFLNQNIQIETQSGNSYEYNDYNCISNAVSLYETNSTLVNFLNEFTEKELEEYDEYIQEKLTEYNLTKNQVLEIYHELNDILAQARQQIFSDYDDLSDSLDDYTEPNKELGEYFLIRK